ncbi:MAG TPA: hypothetical protein VD978_14115 [Azospirillum sp.]|nr:hypothetical protein [Azospirillum sp.]
MTQRQALGQRLSTLEVHLQAEAPDLLPVLGTYRDFDRLLHRLGLLGRDDSLATRIPWWPVIAVLGSTSPDKTAFLDGYRDAAARTAAGAVTVLCYGSEASDGDPRIPFDLGEACRVEASGSERLRGRILVDVAEEAPQAAEHVAERSDVVLAFPGVEPPVSDARKVLTVRSDADVAGIDARMAALGVEHGGRVVALLDTLAEELESELIPYLEAALARWRRSVRSGGAVWLALLGLVLGGAVFLGGVENLPAFAGWLLEWRPARLGGLPLRLLALLAGVGGLWLAGHLWVRRWAANRLASGLPERMGEADLDLRRAFLKSTRLPRSAFGSGVAGWGRGAKRRLAAIRTAMGEHRRSLGSRNTQPQPAAAEAGD